MKIIATNRHEDHYGWGDEIVFHAMIVDENIFYLDDTITIVLKDGSSIEGKISFIKDYSVVIEQNTGNQKQIMFQNINSIH